jgi:hypothetical protein
MIMKSLVLVKDYNLKAVRFLEGHVAPVGRAGLAVQTGVPVTSKCSV